MQSKFFPLRFRFAPSSSPLSRVPLSLSLDPLDTRFRAHFSNSVGELHAALEAATGVPRSDHILLYRGSPLDDRGTLGAHGLPREEGGGGGGEWGGGGGSAGGGPAASGAEEEEGAGGGDFDADLADAVFLYCRSQLSGGGGREGREGREAREGGGEEAAPAAAAAANANANAHPPSLSSSSSLLEPEEALSPEVEVVLAANDADAASAPGAPPSGGDGHHEEGDAEKPEEGGEGETQ